MACKIKTLLLAPVLVLTPGMLAAHPAEQALVLLLPTELYTLGGTLAVFASIVLISVAPPHGSAHLYRGYRLGRGVQVEAPANIASLLSTLFFFALIYVGFHGPNDPQSNLLPQVIWTGWWVGLFIIQGLIGDLWRWINPWAGLHQLLFGKDAKPLAFLPKSLGAWPALALFGLFQMFMLADVAPADPDRLATIALLYWLFTFAGMAVFGRRVWTDQVECFSVLFNLIATLRPVQFRPKFCIGLPGWASLDTAPLDPARALFCLMILVSGSFDGLHETFWWLGQIGINPLEFPGRSAVVWHSILGLICANVLIISIFALCIWTGIRAAHHFGTLQQLSFCEAFNTFAVAILPIALGYHFAHYFVSFLVQSQYLAATLADPLARGWSLFNLGNIRITTGFLNTPDTVRVILLANVGAVVVSHILSVAMAHVLVTRFTTTRRDMVLIQLFLSLLMIAYTIFGLWLLATPRGA